MMIQAFFRSFGATPQSTKAACGCLRERSAREALADGVTISLEARLQQQRDLFQRSAIVWMSLLEPEGFGLAGPQELGRNQETSVGPHRMEVNNNGDITVSSAPRQVAMAGLCGPEDWAASYRQAPAPLRFSNGTVELPNGEKRPYGNTGIIVVMADGRQFAAGRNSKDSSENIRYVAADKGQEIPVSPPGNTTVLYLDERGNVDHQESR